MTGALRKYHFHIWRVFALVLPIIFTAAIVLRPIKQSPEFHSNQFHFEMLQPGLNGVATLKIELINPLQSPSCLVYALSDSNEKFFLGSISHQGEYTFACPKEKIVGVQLFDLLKQKEILTHLFKLQ
jgi:hypothetical protein